MRDSGGVDGRQAFEQARLRARVPHASLPLALGPQGERATQAADVFSFAVVMWELLM